MRTSRAPLVLIACIAAACGGNSSVPTSLDDAQLGLGKALGERVERPITGECTTTFNPPALPLPAVHRQTDSGTCHIAHLGKATIFGEQDINFAAGRQAGWRIITAANGDEVHTQHTGVSAPIAPGIVGFQARMEIVGGTGRFAGATGEIMAEGQANLFTNTAKVRMVSGVIRY